MAGTRTAGTVDGSGVRKDLSITFVDASGDTRTVTLQLPDSASNAQMEAIVAAMQAASNASIWRVGVEEVYEGAFSNDNAEDEVYPSVFDNVTIGYRQVSTGLSKTAYIVAPEAALVGEGDEVQTDNAEYSAVKSAVLAALGSGWETRFTRFTERREINKRKPA